MRSENAVKKVSWGFRSWGPGTASRSEPLVVMDRRGGGPLEP